MMHIFSMAQTLDLSWLSTASACLCASYAAFLAILRYALYEDEGAWTEPLAFSTPYVAYAAIVLYFMDDIASFVGMPVEV